MCAFWSHWLFGSDVVDRSLLASACSSWHLNLLVVLNENHILRRVSFKTRFSHSSCLKWVLRKLMRAITHHWVVHKSVISRALNARLVSPSHFTRTNMTSKLRNPLPSLAARVPFWVLLDTRCDLYSVLDRGVPGVYCLIHRGLGHDVWVTTEFRS